MNGEIDVVCLLVGIDTPAVVTMSHHGTLVSLNRRYPYVASGAADGHDPRRRLL